MLVLQDPESRTIYWKRKLMDERKIVLCKEDEGGKFVLAANIASLCKLWVQLVTNCCYTQVAWNQARNHLGTLGGAKSFLRGAQFFKLCATNFSTGASAPLVNGPAWNGRTIRTVRSTALQLICFDAIHRINYACLHFKTRKLTPKRWLNVGIKGIPVLLLQFLGNISTVPHALLLF